MTKEEEKKVQNEIPIPVFRPTYEEFKDFSKYIDIIEKQEAHKAGMAKIIPPDEWIVKQRGYNKDKLENLEIPSPLHQTFNYFKGKTNYYYEVENIDGNKMSRKKFQDLAESELYKAPKCNSYEDIEKEYWKNLRYDHPVFGADIVGTLIDDDVTEWNINKLGSILDTVHEEFGYEIDGVTNSYLYFGMWRATYAWHTEDMDLYSIDYLHFGEPKTWHVIPPFYGKKLEDFVAEQMPVKSQSCNSYLKHKTCVFQPTLLRKHNIPCSKIVQEAGEIIITFPYGYWTNFSHGFNCSEAANFATPRWVDYGKKALLCSCSAMNPVAIRMDPFVKRFQPDRYEVWKKGQDEGARPEVRLSKESVVAATEKSQSDRVTTSHRSEKPKPRRFKVHLQDDDDKCPRNNGNSNDEPTIVEKAKLPTENGTASSRKRKIEARRTPSISSSGSPESVSEVAEECYESPLKRRTYRESDNGPSKTIEKSRNAQLEKKTVSGTATEKMKINGNACPRLSKCIITLIEPVKSDKETCLEKISDVPRLFTDNPFAKYTLSNVTVKEDDGVFRTEIFLDFEQNDKVKQCDDSRASDDDDSQKPLSAQVIESSDTNFSVASPKIPTLFAANSWTDLPEDPKEVSKSPVKSDALAPGDTVFALDVKMDRFRQAKIMSVQGISYKVKFHDGSYTDNLDPSNVLDHNHDSEDLQCGAKVKVKLNGGKIEEGVFCGKNEVRFYKVVFGDKSQATVMHTAVRKLQDANSSEMSNHKRASPVAELQNGAVTAAKKPLLGAQSPKEQIITDNNNTHDCPQLESSADGTKNGFGSNGFSSSSGMRRHSGLVANRYVLSAPKIAAEKSPVADPKSSPSTLFTSSVKTPWTALAPTSFLNGGSKIFAKYDSCILPSFGSIAKPMNVCKEENLGQARSLPSLSPSPISSPQGAREIKEEQ